MVLVGDLGKVLGFGAKHLHVFASSVPEHLSCDGRSLNSEGVHEDLHVAIHGISAIVKLGEINCAGEI